MKGGLIILFISLFQFTCAQLPKGFVYVKDVIPDIQIELRYCSLNNFVGEPIEGYNAEVCILSSKATLALKAVQNSLRPYNLSLKIYDAYRPQRAVNHFWSWAKKVNDTLMKPVFYPNVNKKDLFDEGYIATRSGHSRGSTLDLTLADLTTGKPLDMGSSYDYFGEESWVLHKNLSSQQKANRMLLQTIMNSHGFNSYPKEWWHFTLRWEPFPETYFDFEIE